MPTRQQRRALRLIERDGDRCHYCRTELSDLNRTLDHRVPKAEGGGADLKNLVLACYACNHYRGKMEYQEFYSLVQEQIEAGCLTRKRWGGTTSNGLKAGHAISLTGIKWIAPPMPRPKSR